MASKKGFKVELRKDCKVCHKPITEPRYRTYCSGECRMKAMNQRWAKSHAEWHRQAADKKASVPSKDKLQCAICKRWYVQVGSHVAERHGMTAREYREEYGLPLKRGVVPGWYRKQKGNQALSNGTFQNLKVGKKFHYKKGDPRAKVKKGQHGFKSNPHRKPDNFYE